MKRFNFLFVFSLIFLTGITQKITGFADAQNQLETEKQFKQAIQPASIGNMIKTLSEKQHHLGSAGSKAKKVGSISTKTLVINPLWYSKNIKPVVGQ